MGSIFFNTRLDSFQPHILSVVIYFPFRGDGYIYLFP